MTQTEFQTLVHNGSSAPNGLKTHYITVNSAQALVLCMRSSTLQHYCTGGFNCPEQNPSNQIKLHR